MDTFGLTVVNNIIIINLTERHEAFLNYFANE